MFDKNKFAQTLKNIMDTYESQREFSKKSEINRTYLSQYMNMKLNKPPKPYILNKLANASNGIITYTQLMIICGYYQEPNKDIENYIYTVFQEIASYSTNPSITKSLLNNFIKYQNDLIDSFLYKDKKRVLKISYYIESSRISMPYFMILHDSLIKYLVNNNIIYINNTSLLIDWHNNDEVCNYLDTFSLPILFSYDSKYFKLYEEIENQQIVNIIKQYGISLNYLFSLYCSNNSNMNMFNNSAQYYMCPMYNKIQSEKPYFVDNNIVSRIILDTNIYNIKQDCAYFSIEVNNNYTNFRNTYGNYIIFQKDSFAKDDDVVLVIVDNSVPTIKKYKKLSNSIIVLHPIDLTDCIEPLVVDTTKTKIHILGKAIGYFGKMEMK